MPLPSTMSANDQGPIPPGGSAAPELSIVIPTYNERENIAVFIPQLAREFRDVGHEIIVVDDSSSDGTADAVRAMSRELPQLRLLSRPAKLGVGSALRDGYNAARGAVILSSDADLAFAPADLRELFEAIRSGHDLAVGSRHSASSGRDIPTWGGWGRYLVSRMGNRFLRLVFRVPLDDFSMNCRAIRQGLWAGLDTRANNNFFFYEMIILARRAGARIIGIPVVFTDRRYGISKVNLLTEIPRACYQLIRFLLRR